MFSPQLLWLKDNVTLTLQQITFFYSYRHCSESFLCYMYMIDDNIDNWQVYAKVTLHRKLPQNICKSTYVAWPGQTNVSHAKGVYRLARSPKAAKDNTRFKAPLGPWGLISKLKPSLRWSIHCGDQFILHKVINSLRWPMLSNVLSLNLFPFITKICCTYPESRSFTAYKNGTVFWIFS